MASRAREEYRYEKLTWPEINDAVELGKVCIVPCGAVEQHGPHLPLDVDLVCPLGIAHGAGREIPDKMLVLPIVAYGYTGHVMDFPGTINNDFEHFMHHVLDITKSLAYHGFKKIILLNGHGSNMPNLDLVARRTNLETDAECVPGRLVEPADGRQGRSCPRWRQSKFPGGCSHACELETSLYLYLDGDNVRKDQIKSGDDQLQRGGQPVQLGRPVRGRARRRSSRGPAATPRPACWATPSWPPPRRAARPTRRRSSSSSRFVTWFKDRPKDVRRDLHRQPPTMPIPWGQRPFGG